MRATDFQMLEEVKHVPSGRAGRIVGLDRAMDTLRVSPSGDPKDEATFTAPASEFASAAEPSPAEVKAAVAAHIERTWTSRTCPMCGSNRWAVHAYVPVELSPRIEAVWGGQVLPSAGIVCQTCGNTVLVNLIVAGVLKGKAEGSNG